MYLLRVLRADAVRSMEYILPYDLFDLTVAVIAHQQVTAGIGGKPPGFV